MYHIELWGVHDMSWMKTYVFYQKPLCSCCTQISILTIRHFIKYDCSYDAWNKASLCTPTSACSLVFNLSSLLPSSITAPCCTYPKTWVWRSAFRVLLQNYKTNWYVYSHGIRHVFSLYEIIITKFICKYIFYLVYLSCLYLWSLQILTKWM